MTQKRKIYILIHKEEIEPEIWDRIASKDYWNLGIDYADQDLFLTWTEGIVHGIEERQVYSLKGLLTLDNRISNYSIDIEENGLWVSLWEL